ncbi:MAG: hypothetical protein ACKVZH_21920 [Blastocatellia bacterium]
MFLEHLNSLTLAVFAPILILVGILGFVIPANKSLTSGVTSYNIFHIASGVIGVIIILTGHEGAIRAFNIGFGLIDLYQAVASFANLFPKQLFKWTRVDDILHVVIGVILVLIGVFGQ